jgi:hypothetical protein
MELSLSILTTFLVICFVIFSFVVVINKLVQHSKTPLPDNPIDERIKNEIERAGQLFKGGTSK